MRGFTMGGAPTINNVDEIDIVTRSKEKGKKEPKDIGAATFDSLVKAVVNQKLDYSKVKTSMIENIHKDHTDVYLSTIPEFTQAEIDAIMEAPVDDIPLCVVKSIEETLNPHFIFDSQLFSDFSDIVVAVHQATKIPAKRTRTKSKVFKSLYLTENIDSQQQTDFSRAILRRRTVDIISNIQLRYF
ncbi:hypothetical protein P3S68_011666 [Capsicum galapagoense]